MKEYDDLIKHKCNLMEKIDTAKANIDSLKKDVCNLRVDLVETEKKIAVLEYRINQGNISTI